MHILVIHEQFLAPGAGGGSRHNEFAKIWRDAGHEVTVVAGMTSYTTGAKPDRYRRKLVVDERSEDGVRVLRSFTPSGNAPGIPARLARYFAFAGSATFAAISKAKRVDVVIATSPSLLVAIPGVFAARKHRAPLIFEVRDLWPDFAIEMGALKGRVPIRMARSLERWAYRQACVVACLTPAFVEKLAARGVPREKLVMLPNGPDIAKFAPGPRDNAARLELGWGDRCVALYAGAHGRANGLGQVLDAAEILRDDPRILFALVGDGEEKARLVDEARRRGLENVAFLPEQPKAKVPELVRASDVALAVLRNVKGFETVYPNKVFDAMACARPVIVAIPGAIRALVEGADAGVGVPPEDPRALAEAVRALAEDPPRRAAMGEAGRALVEREYSRARTADRYLIVMERAIKFRTR